MNYKKALISLNWAQSSEDDFSFRFFPMVRNKMRSHAHRPDTLGKAVSFFPFVLIHATV